MVRMLGEDSGYVPSTVDISAGTVDGVGHVLLHRDDGFSVGAYCAVFATTTRVSALSTATSVCRRCVDGGRRHSATPRCRRAADALVSHQATIEVQTKGSQ